MDMKNLCNPAGPVKAIHDAALHARPFSAESPSKKGSSSFPKSPSKMTDVEKKFFMKKLFERDAIITKNTNKTLDEVRQLLPYMKKTLDSVRNVKTNYLAEEKKCNDGIAQCQQRYLSECRAEQDRIMRQRNMDPLPNLTRRLKEKAAAALLK